MNTITALVPLSAVVASATVLAQISGIQVKAGDQVVDLMSPEAEDIIRAKYQNSRNVPDGVAFIEAAKMFEIYSTRDSDGGVGYLSRESGLNAEDAAAAIKLSIRARLDYNDEVARERNKYGCTTEGLPKIYGEAVFVFLDSMDDRRELIGEKYYQQVLAQLSPRSAAMFRRWVDASKEDIIYIKFDHKKSFEQNNVNADAVLASICS